MFYILDEGVSTFGRPDMLIHVGMPFSTRQVILYRIQKGKGKLANTQGL